MLTGASASSRVVTALRPSAAAARTVAFYSTRSFSATAAAKEQEEGPVIPGVGKGKTSTGLVCRCVVAEALLMERAFAVG